MVKKQKSREFNIIRSYAVEISSVENKGLKAVRAARKSLILGSTA